MMSIYTSTLLATAVITGLTVYSMSESHKIPAYAMNSETVMQAHHLANQKALGVYETVSKTSDSMTELPLGPYFRGGAMRSYLIVDANPSPTATSPASYVFSFYDNEKASENKRVQGRLKLPEDTSVEIYGENGTLIAGKDLPVSGVSIPPGSVAILTTITDGETTP